jgi:hypothetical protein
VSDDVAASSDRLNVNDPLVQAKLDKLKKEIDRNANFSYVKDSSSRGEWSMEIRTGYNTRSEYLSIIDDALSVIDERTKAIDNF